MSLSNMAMMVGKLGKPGCGVNPIRGQNNVQGACDMGASPNQFSGYQNIDKPGVLEKFEKAWDTKLNPNIGTKATDCFPKMISGDIKGLFIFGEDPVRTDPNTCLLYTSTLMERLIPELIHRGLKVATVKHDGHSFEPDSPGTDSYRFWQAGVSLSLIHIYVCWIPSSSSFCSIGAT